MTITKTMASLGTKYTSSKSRGDDVIFTIRAVASDEGAEIEQQREGSGLLTSLPHHVWSLIPLACQHA